MDIVDNELIEIHKKFRSLVTYLSSETGFMNALCIDIVWKTLLVKYERCFKKMDDKY